MKKALFLCLVLLLLTFVACSSKVDEELSEDLPIDEETNIPEPTLEVELEKEVVVEEERDPADWLVENRIGEYNYVKTSVFTKKTFQGYGFSGFEAEYSFDKTNALVSVLFFIDESDFFGFLDFLDKSKNYVLLEIKDFDYLEHEVYFNPYDNVYVWISRGSVVVIESSIGTDLLEKYSNNLIPSKMEGVYADESFKTEFNDINEENFFAYNKKLFSIQLVDLDRSDETMTFVVNGIEKILHKGTNILGTLLVDINEVNFASSHVELEIQEEVKDFASLTLSLNEEQTITLDGQTHVIKSHSVDADEMDIKISVDDSSRTYRVGTIQRMDDISIKLIELFISNVGEDSATSFIDVWI